MSSFVIYPYVSEKASVQMEDSKYTFILEGDANKVELQQYFKSNYGLSIKKINVLNRPSKKIRKGRKIVVKNQPKKIIVTFNSSDDLSKISEMY